MNSYDIISIRQYQDSDDYCNSLATIAQTLKVTFLVFNNVLFSLLILYKLRKSKDVQDQNFHEPIFNQLFYNSAAFLVLNNIIVFSSFFWDLSDEATALTYLTAAIISIEVFLECSCSILFAIITLFSFLASIQRIIMIYFSDYKWIVTGNWLKYQILLVYASLIHYSYITVKCFPSIGNIICSTDETKRIYYTYNTVFLVMSLISGAIYFHIWRIFRKLKTGDNGTYLLYQFVPIHTMLLIHSLAQSIGELLDETLEIQESHTISLYSNFIFVPNIPAVVSLSYIVSQRSFRQTFTIIFYPVWRELSS
ncbi:hypothetical protein CRE_08277 [Caenorhabditis remanei]|uniref:Uncharacterized protein n=1 Tax=Caenorhabditis remanei TaxID=31234 RepID=E3M3F1_CAERE|nr:hypothetical protein CRE_08277 [Caenorhabditis remanei]